jgi:hypothetical protein
VAAEEPPGVLKGRDGASVVGFARSAEPHWEARGASGRRPTGRAASSTAGAGLYLGVVAWAFWAVPAFAEACFIVTVLEERGRSVDHEQATPVVDGPLRQG